MGQHRTLGWRRNVASYAVWGHKIRAIFVRRGEIMMFVQRRLGFRRDHAAEKRRSPFPKGGSEGGNWGLRGGYMYQESTTK